MDNFTINIIIMGLLIIGLLSFISYNTNQEINKTYQAGQPINVINKPLAGSVDAFGRGRISLPYTIGDYTHIYGSNPDFFDVVDRGGSIQYLENKAAVELSIDSGTSGSAIHQTKRYHQYMPGKSQSILSSFNFLSPEEGVTKRTGYMDDNNGIFFQQTGDGELSFNIRSYTSGAVTERKVVKNDWNGNSELDLDITKTQLLFIDFQWLGVGKVRCGFVIKDDYIVCHTFYNSNTLTEVFMSNPNLPIRCEISSEEVIASGASMNQICSTVISEGGYVENGRDWAFGTSAPVTINNNTETAILAIKLKDTYGQYNYDNRMTVRLGNINILTTGEDIKYNVRKITDGDSLSTSWLDINEESGVQRSISDLTIPTNSYLLSSAYAAGNAQGSKNFASSSGNAPPITAKQNYIVQNFESNNSEAYLLTAQRIGGDTANVTASMQWREIY